MTAPMDRTFRLPVILLLISRYFFGIPSEVLGRVIFDDLHPLQKDRTNRLARFFLALVNASIPGVRQGVGGVRWRGIWNRFSLKILAFVSQFYCSEAFNEAFR